MHRESYCKTKPIKVLKPTPPAGMNIVGLISRCIESTYKCPFSAFSINITTIIKIAVRAVARIQSGWSYAAPQEQHCKTTSWVEGGRGVVGKAKGA